MTLRRRLGDEGYAELRRRIDADYDARYAGAQPEYIAVSERRRTTSDSS